MTIKHNVCSGCCHEIKRCRISSDECSCCLSPPDAEHGTGLGNTLDGKRTLCDSKLNT